MNQNDNRLMAILVPTMLTILVCIAAIWVVRQDIQGARLRLDEIDKKLDAK